jgi:hypothetical protein|eukprot:COSAG01_NODE_1816_length_9171_cov_12.651306_4_plen_77_part_00
MVGQVLSCQQHAAKPLASYGEQGDAKLVPTPPDETYSSASFRSTLNAGQLTVTMFGVLIKRPVSLRYWSTTAAATA